MTLADKIRASRNLTVEVDHMKFYARRPSIEEYGALFQEGTPDPEIARRYVTGWDGVRECDLLEGGAETLVAFDSNLWKEAVSDLPVVWREICKALVAATQSHMDKVVENRKNS